MTDNPAAKLQTIMELYNNGFLCKCKDAKWDGTYNELGEQIFILDHSENCEGKEKFMEILSG